MVFGKRRPDGGAYIKMVKEDPEETRHRSAQFRIYRVMQKADSRRRQSPVTVRICRLKIKVGKRFLRLKKHILFSVSLVRDGLHEQLMTRVSSFKGLLRSRQDVATLPPLFC